MKNIPILFFILILIGSIGLFYGFKDNNQNKTMLLFNNDDYAAAWKTIDSLEAQGLPKSAQEKVEALYKRAVRDNNPSQIIKTVIYRGKYLNQLEEGGAVKAINLLKKELELATFPAKPILHSMLAEGYTRYLDNNYWRFSNRTATPAYVPDDLATWSIQQLSETAMQHHKAALADERIKQVALSDFTAITNKGPNAEGLRPFLFDFLAHRAIDYFSNERSYLTEPAYKFYINDPIALAPAADFAQHSFTAQDDSSPKYQTLLLLQELIANHLKSNNAAALVDADLKRLNFVHQNGVIENKGALYLAALEKLYQTHQKESFSTEVIHDIANYHYLKGQEYTSNPRPEVQFELKKALEWCDRAIEAFPNAYGTNSCRQLKNGILQKVLSVVTEKVVIPNEPFLSMVNYRNIEKVWVKVARVDYDFIERTNRLRKNEKVQAFQQLPSKDTWSVDLPNDEDYQQHRVELKMKALELGQYVVLVASKADFSDEQSALSYHFVHVSNIAFFDRKNNENHQEFVLMNRKTGTPTAGVKAECYSREYNRNNRQRTYRKIKEGISDKDGLVAFPSEDRANYRIKFSKGADQLYLDDFYYDYRSRRQNNSFQVTHFFLDRAIYRPGQTIYFKGLAIEKDPDGMPSIVTNEPVEVSFLDVNYQEVAKLKLKTNEFGTFNGSFTAPQGGLLGQMHIKSSIGGNQHFFRVEEYKRPRFEVKIDKVKEAYRLNEEVTINGTAKAFAGSNVDGAKVTYRVSRVVAYPYYPYWRYSYRPPNGNPMEIANGTSQTDASGLFSFKFKAIPDLSANKELQPQFNYNIEVTVVDITGETHSTSTSVSVGYVALKLGLDLPNLINRDDLKSLMIQSQNLSGEFAAAQGTIKIDRLQSPESPLKKRLWTAPDRFVMDKAAFKRDFPNDVYHNEDQMANWPIAATQLSQAFDTEKNKEQAINAKEWPSGSYALTIESKDRYGTAVELKKFFTLYDLAENAIPTGLPYIHELNQVTFQPGDQAKIHFASALRPSAVLFEVEEDRQVVRREWLNANQALQLQLDVQEKHLGNFHYSLAFIQDNRPYFELETIAVPWKEKDLSIEYGTFRDKLYPGQEEQWVIKVSGHKKDKVAAEMLAGMYDASLDQFVKNQWRLDLFPSNYQARAWRSNNFTTRNGQLLSSNWQPNSSSRLYRQYPSLNWFGFQFRDIMMVQEMRLDSSPMMRSRAKMAAPAATRSDNQEMAMADEAVTYESDAVVASANVAIETQNEVVEEQAQESDFSEVKIRTNLKETVFFFPNLMTDEEGNVLIKFTMNEALTRWKFMGLAHTKDLKTAITEKEVLTQKDLMVIPNPPRFIREGDQIEFTAKVSNLTDQTMQGSAVLQLFDALTMKPVDELLGNQKANINFTAEAGQSDRLAWTLTIPKGKVMAITHRVIAKAGNFSDGEESSLPVLTNRMLVTETQPLPIAGKERKIFNFEAMKKASASSSLQHHRYTLEFTSNPAWLAVQALPYMMDYPYQCTEQIFNRFYANALASSVANEHPKIKRVFEQWKGTEALESNLSKNQELKTALLEETPWVLEAQSEAQQKRNIGLLFDLNRMSYEQEQALTALADRQLGNGGFSWFPGGRASRYISQYLVEGMGHLDQLGVKALKEDEKMSAVLRKAVAYIDSEIVEEYELLEEAVSAGRTKWEDDHLSNMAIHYLYARSFFPEMEWSGQAEKVRKYYLEQAEKYWLNKGIYQEGMLALALHRDGQKEVPAKIVRSLKERSLNHEEMGMYWKYGRGYYWHQLPIESQALMIEVFDEVAEDQKAVNDLKVWLLKTKQTTHWKTTKATAAAVYALLNSGENWLLADAQVSIAFPASSNSRINEQIKAAQETAEAGTGYFKTSFEGSLIGGGLSAIEVDNPNANIAWGAVYWQYFEDLDKIKTFEETPLTLKKQLFLEKASDRGPIMEELKTDSQLEPGDKIKVRIELRVDRPMEYVHMKDMRASGLEPINVLSHYKWQGGLGYYESTRDASTNFFFSYLPKGTHVFEYPLRVNHKGDFSNGITTIQCMYAPEFTSHSEGIRIKVE